MDIGGLLPGDPSGQAITTRQSLYKARSYIAALSGVLTPALTNELRAGFVRSWTWSPTITPFPSSPRFHAAGAHYVGLLEQFKDQSFAQSGVHEGEAPPVGPGSGPGRGAPAR